MSRLSVSKSCWEVSTPRDSPRAVWLGLAVDGLDLVGPAMIGDWFAAGRRPASAGRRGKSERGDVHAGTIRTRCRNVGHVSPARRENSPPCGQKETVVRLHGDCVPYCESGSGKPWRVAA